MRERAFQTLFAEMSRNWFIFSKAANGGARIWSLVDNPSRPSISQFNFSLEFPDFLSSQSP